MCTETFSRKRTLRSFGSAPRRLGGRKATVIGWLAVLAVVTGGPISSQIARAEDVNADDPGPPARIRIDEGHPWRPPFDLDRIGWPLQAVVELSSQHEPSSKYTLVALRDGKELSRTPLQFADSPPWNCQVSLNPWPTQLVLLDQPADGPEVELARQDVAWDTFEAAVVARPDQLVHPVDLGTILVPNDWLLLAAGRSGTILGLALSRSGDPSTVQVTAWFEAAPEEQSAVALALTPDSLAKFLLPVPKPPAEGDHHVLRVAITTATGERLWEHSIPTMLVRQPLRLPTFGAVETQLRYDAPISVRADDGTYSSMRYADGWDPALRDVVVSLPNGSRFVFWRGSSYIPFWAGESNTGLSYEWAETSPPPDGVDCVEPLMDKELRYGRVEIVESTPARVHVRWSYQSCDFNYKVWGDSAVEDFHFYPDGFGTRVLTLQSVPTGDYELSEFIILTPQATYPLSVLPANLVDILFVDGEKRELTFPFFPAEQGEKVQSRDMPAIYRVRMHLDEPLAAIYFNPLQSHPPAHVFAPFFDGGQLVTSTYWGSHWPLARGKTTGWAIDDRVHHTPCHNSVMSWARQRPKPLRRAELETLDTLGRCGPMVVQTWVWLIGMSADDDARILEWARSFSKPPALVVDGARLEAESYIPERRAIRLVVESNPVTITIKPDAVCVNPVFELCSAPPDLAEVHLAGRRLMADEYAWDGLTLWLDATLTDDTPLRLVFD
jgi:hypothetical protein